MKGKKEIEMKTDLIELVNESVQKRIEKQEEEKERKKMLAILFTIQTILIGLLFIVS